MTFRIPKMSSLSKPPASMTEMFGLMGFINADDATKEDVMVTGGKLGFTDRKTLAVPTKHGVQEFSFTPWSFAQFADLLKIPPRYLETCPLTGKGSMKDQIENRMNDRDTKDHLVRLRRTATDDGLSGLVRAVLPGNYAPFDNRHMLQAVSRVVKEDGDHFMMELTNAHDPKSIEQSFHMRFTRKASFNLDEIGINDPHKIGFHCLTSEVGYTDVNLNALVWRLVCKNGMMGWGDSELFHTKHKNFQHHEIAPQLQEGILSSIRQEGAIKALLEREYSLPVEDPESEILLMGARMRASDRVKELALTAFKASGTLLTGEPTRFDVMQAFTRAAQSLSINDRMKLESAVGRAFFGGGRGTVGPEPRTIDTTAEEN